MPVNLTEVRRAESDHPGYIQTVLDYLDDTLTDLTELNKPDWGDSVGRNDPCPCGSGRKFKKCCR